MNRYMMRRQGHQSNMRKRASISVRQTATPETGQRSARYQEGFTLIEILVVITIIGLIMGLVGPRVLTYLSEAKVKAATIQIQSFASSLDLFYLDIGRYPNSSEGLVALVRQPGGVTGWNGPYLKNNSVPLDPWNHPYRYKSPGDHGPYDIISLGADGQKGRTGTAADIKNWELNK